LGGGVSLWEAWLFYTLALWAIFVLITRGILGPIRDVPWIDSPGRVAVGAVIACATLAAVIVRGTERR
jgi:hypothetical protein